MRAVTVCRLCAGIFVWCLYTGRAIGTVVSHSLKDVIKTQDYWLYIFFHIFNNQHFKI